MTFSRLYILRCESLVRAHNNKTKTTTRTIERKWAN